MQVSSLFNTTRKNGLTQWKIVSRNSVFELCEGSLHIDVVVIVSYLSIFICVDYRRQCIARRRRRRYYSLLEYIFICADLGLLHRVMRGEIVSADIVNVLILEGI